MSNIPKEKHFEIIDASGRTVLPAWCDSHTHSVFTGSRSDEYIDRIKGLSYQEIANKGGGILKSANQIQNISKNDLLQEWLCLRHEMLCNHKLRCCLLYNSSTITKLSNKEKN